MALKIVQIDYQTVLGPYNPSVAQMKRCTEADARCSHTNLQTICECKFRVCKFQVNYNLRNIFCKKCQIADFGENFSLFLPPGRIRNGKVGQFKNLFKNTFSFYMLICS